MGEVVRFIPKAERERIHLIQVARAMYDSVFPPAVSVNEQRDKAATILSVDEGNGHHGREIQP